MKPLPTISLPSELSTHYVASAGLQHDRPGRARLRLEVLAGADVVEHEHPQPRADREYVALEAGRPDAAAAVPRGDLFHGLVCAAKRNRERERKIFLYFYAGENNNALVFSRKKNRFSTGLSLNLAKVKSLKRFAWRR